MQIEHGIPSGSQTPRRVFGWFEAFFDILYLAAAFTLALRLLFPPQTALKSLAGVMALVLSLGDAFHLVPRILAVARQREGQMQKALGIGKLITSITMTAFYVLLWHAALLLLPDSTLQSWTYVVYTLAAVRVSLCLFPQNCWLDSTQPMRWAIYRNVPFVLIGAVMAVRFAHIGNVHPSLSGMWLAILLSFAFYLPVALFAGKNRMLGMLMLPKTLMYLWMLWMFYTL